jgi:hypothetical protein
VDREGRVREVGNAFAPGFMTWREEILVRGILDVCPDDDPNADGVGNHALTERKPPLLEREGR